MDTNGVFYWIGTNEGRQPYNNPIRQGKVTVHLSSHGGDDTSCIADRNPDSSAAENSYGEDGNPWLAINFKNHSVNPSHYVICQQGDHLLRNWQLEASNDTNPNISSKQWTTLCIHTEDESISGGPPAMAVFKVPERGQYWSWFRVYVTGPSHKGQPNFDITQMEFYGSLTTTEKDKDSAGASSGAKQGSHRFLAA